MTAKKSSKQCAACGTKFVPNGSCSPYCSLRCRFGAKFRESKTGCWLWKGPLRPDGRGQFNIDNRPHLAHVVAWTLTNGPVPTGLVVCHRCDIPKCVNPSHLFVGTKKDNSQDMVRKGRDKRRKLSDATVLEIRAKLAKGGSLRKLAAEYGVTNQNIVHIKKGRTFEYLLP